VSNDSTRPASGLLLMTRPRSVEQGRSERLIVWMPAAVAARLRALGFEQPVVLDRLPGMWWSIHADLAALDRASEPGCGYAKAVASTEAISGHFSAYWMEMLDGPFDNEEAARRAST
jgi:hypothetical protein